MLAKSNFRGIYAIIVTPFTTSLKLDEQGLERTVAFSLAAGVHGVVANALASEGGYLGEAERKRAAEIVVGLAKGKVPTIVAVSAPHAVIATDYAQHAERIGADAIMSLPPTLHPATVDDIKAHYRALALATTLPLVLQNATGQGATTMSAQLIAELVNELPSAGFVKEESAYPAQTVGEIIRLSGSRLQGVMGGRAGKTLMEELRHGVAGTMPACEIADVHVDLWNAITVGDEPRARLIFRRLLPLLDLETSYGVPLMKEVLKMRGVIDGTAVRQSGFRPLDTAAREEAVTVLDGLTEFMLPAFAHRR